MTFFVIDLLDLAGQFSANAFMQDFPIFNGVINIDIFASNNSRLNINQAEGIFVASRGSIPFFNASLLVLSISSGLVHYLKLFSYYLNHGGACV